jgi:SAM-dependent methyltransferase
VAVYDLLAPHYDAVTGDCATEAAFVDHVLGRARPRPVTLLEVACGTGAIMASLAGRYRVAGLDVSPGMLAVARGKLPPGTPLHLADMSRFRLGVRFDAIICVYHGVNHLLGFPAWESFFDRAVEHLNDGGVFVFDVLTPANLQEMAGRPPIVQRFGQNCLRLTVHADGPTFGWDIEVLECQHGGGYRSFTEVIQTASFPPAQVRAALGRRFAGVEIIESDGGVTGDDGENRTWFVGTKPRPGAYSGAPGPPGGSR